MKKISLSLIAVILISSFAYWQFKPQVASAACGSGYGFCRTVTIDHTKVPSTQTNFTILASTTLATLKTVGNGGNINNTVSFNGQTVAADLVFSTTADCSTLMSWDFDRYVPTTGEIEVWTLVSSLSSSVDTTIYMCYGKASVSTYQGGSVGAAWDSNTKDVYHFPDGSTLGLKDAKGALNATNNNAIAATGIIDGGFSTNAAAGYVKVVGMNSLNGASQMTVSLWINPVTTPGYGSLFSSGYQSQLDVFNTGGTPAITADFGTSITGNLRVAFDNAGGGQITTGVWNYVTLTYDGSTLRFYENAAQAPTTGAFTGTINNSGTDTGIGGDVSLNTMNASFDEVHVSTTARSANWITTELNNQIANSTMLTFGSEQAGTTSPLGATAAVKLPTGKIIIMGKVSIPGN